jgi:TolB protein
MSLTTKASLLLAATALVAIAAVPAVAQESGAGQIVVSGGQRSLFKIAVAPMMGDEKIAREMEATASRDFVLSSLFQVLDPKGFSQSMQSEGLAMEPSSWRNIGAEGVVKGTSATYGSRVKLVLRLYVVTRGREAVLQKEYDVAQSEVKRAVHQFDNEVVKWFTGQPGFFGSRLVYSASTGQGTRGIFEIGADGEGPAKLSTVSDTALAPSFGPGGVYYSGGLPDGSYSLFKVGNPVAVLKDAGMIFGAAFHGGKMAVVIGRGGESDIYVGSPDGSNLHKVTNGGLNSHPAFGPGGQLAYVSSSGGSPNIVVDGKRLTTRGSYNTSPVWCADPEGVKVLYMSRDGGNWDIFSTTLGGDVKRLTQDQGSNTYPACSPDGRAVAFFSTRGGLYLSNLQGQNQQKIASVQGMSLRWEGN